VYKNTRQQARKHPNERILKQNFWTWFRHTQSLKHIPTYTLYIIRVESSSGKKGQTALTKTSLYFKWRRHFFSKATEIFSKNRQRKLLKRWRHQSQKLKLQFESTSSENKNATQRRSKTPHYAVLKALCRRFRNTDSRFYQYYRTHPRTEMYVSRSHRICIVYKYSQQARDVSRLK